MNNSYGMAFGTNQQQIIQQPQYTTAQDRLQFNLNNPYDELFDLVNIAAGTNLVVSYGSKAIETLKIIHHGLGFTPQVFMSFFPFAAGTVPNDTNGYYNLEYWLLAQGGAGTDYVTYVPDDQDVTIQHVVDNTPSSGSSGSTTSSAGTYNVQVKYLICNNVRIHTPNYQ